jgi:hypothetical protein
MLIRKQNRPAPIFINRSSKPTKEKTNINTDIITEMGYRDNEGFLVLPKEEYYSGDDDYENDFIKLCEENGDDWREILRR